MQTESGRAQIKSSQIKLCSGEKVRSKEGEVKRGLQNIFSGNLSSFFPLIAGKGDLLNNADEFAEGRL